MRLPKAPKPDTHTLCTRCSKPVLQSDDYVWDKIRGGGYAFMHARCWKEIPKVGDTPHKKGSIS